MQRFKSAKVYTFAHFQCAWHSHFPLMKHPLYPRVRLGNPRELRLYNRRFKSAKVYKKKTTIADTTKDKMMNCKSPSVDPGVEDPSPLSIAPSFMYMFISASESFLDLVYIPSIHSKKHFPRFFPLLFYIKYILCSNPNTSTNI